MKSQGSSLVEYGFIGALVLLLCLGAVQNIANSVQGQMVGLHASLQRNRDAAANAQEQAQQETAEADETPGSVIPDPADGQQQVCYESGWCVNVPIVQNGTTLTTTTGSMGGQLTREFANVFRQIADQLRTDPNTDPALLDLITQLANNGHSIADTIDFANNWCPPGTNCGELDSAGGSIYTALQNNLNNINATQSNFQSSYQQLQEYLASNPSALPPEMQAVINLETQQINTTADAYETNGIGSTTCQNAGDTACYGWNVTDTVLIHQDANTICSSGGNTSQCVR